MPKTESPVRSTLTRGFSHRQLRGAVSYPRCKHCLQPKSLSESGPYGALASTRVGRSCSLTRRDETSKPAPGPPDPHACATRSDRPQMMRRQAAITIASPALLAARINVSSCCSERVSAFASCGCSRVRALGGKVSQRDWCNAAKCIPRSDGTTSVGAQSAEMPAPFTNGCRPFESPPSPPKVRYPTF
jgi:hypothetical protein